MSVLDRLRSLIVPSSVKASVWPETLSIDDFARMLTLGTFGFGMNQTYTGNREEITADFQGLVHGAYRSNGVVFACMLTRMLLFSEARFQFQQMRGGRPGDLFGTPDLALLERPEPGKTTGDLLARAITDSDLAGNWFAARRPNRIKRMRPDWTWIVLGSESDRDMSPTDIDAEVLGYVYQPGGIYSSEEPQTFARNEVAHFAPIPDPLASYRGMSWLTPVIREMRADTAATFHKLQFFEHAATPNVVVKFAPTLPEPKAREWIELFEQEHSGVLNAYRTAYLGGGADLTVVGKDLKEMDFKATQGAGETRIAAAAGIHPTIVGLSEGLQGSSLNAGNFGAARRITADRTLRPLWRNMAGSLETIIPAPTGARLWYDSRDIPFLADDIKDAAEVQSLQSQAINILTTAGFEPRTVIDAIVSGDFRRLQHNGLFSVQLQPPGQEQLEPAALMASAMRVLASGQPLALTPGSSDGAEPGEIRCPSCNDLLAEAATAPYRFTCRRCKTPVAA